MITKPNQRLCYYRFLKLLKTKGFRFRIMIGMSGLSFLANLNIDQKAYDQYLSYKKAGKSFGEGLDIDTTLKKKLNNNLLEP